MEKRCSFELFKSNVCHWLKEEGDIDFLIQVLESDLIRKHYNPFRDQPILRLISEKDSSKSERRIYPIFP